MFNYNDSTIICFCISFYYKIVIMKINSNNIRKNILNKKIKIKICFILYYI